nr:uncharacterized protein CTRU02_02209 [Colletotrichum truncatum]KAF6799338.1 hypothetical protein CTRU02_02209 [Colletotrichum truncatum]
MLDEQDMLSKRWQYIKEANRQEMTRKNATGHDTTRYDNMSDGATEAMPKTAALIQMDAASKTRRWAASNDAGISVS